MSYSTKTMSIKDTRKEPWVSVYSSEPYEMQIGYFRFLNKVWEYVNLSGEQIFPGLTEFLEASLILIKEEHAKVLATVKVKH